MGPARYAYAARRARGQHICCTGLNFKNAATEDQQYEDYFCIRAVLTEFIIAGFGQCFIGEGELFGISSYFGFWYVPDTAPASSMPSYAG